MSTSLAAVFAGVPNQFELREFPLPQPAAGEILVRILGCTICGSDLHSLHGRRQVSVPTVLGHEIVGQIAELGVGAPREDLAGQPLRIGDRITWSLVASCGQCFFCHRDLPQKCSNAVKYGHERLSAGRELLGGLAEHALLVPGTAIVRLPDQLPLEVACPANCATATAEAAIEAAGDLAGSCVCVFGAGLLGLTVGALARSLDAAEVICVDISEQRRLRACQFGATKSVAPSEVAELAAQLSAGRGVDVVFEVSGSPAAFQTAWPIVRTGARLILVGSVFPSEAVPLALDQVVRRHLTLCGIHNYRPRHLLAAVRNLVALSSKYPFASLVAQWHPLSQVDQAFRAAADPNHVRVGIRGIGSA